MKKSELKEIIKSILLEDRDLLKDLIKEIMIEMLGGQASNPTSIKPSKIKKSQDSVTQSSALPANNIDKLKNIIGLFGGDDMAPQNNIMGGSVEGYLNSNSGSPVRISKSLPSTMSVSTENGKISVNNNAVSNAIQQLIRSGNFRVE